MLLRHLVSGTALFACLACATGEDPDPLNLGNTGGAASGGNGGAAATGGAPTTGGAPGTGSVPTGGLGTGSAGTGGGLPTGGAATGGAIGTGGGTLTCTVPPCNDGAVCTWVSDCKSGVCGTSGKCICGNGILDGAETDVDCGGECGGCTGTTCTGETDCAPVLVCAGTCTHCGDGQMDGDETGIDCGGALCPKCYNEACVEPTECLSADCTGGLCGKIWCVEGWREDPAGAQCLNATQGDFRECITILDCYIANQCGPGTCGANCRPTQGTAGEQLASTVYTAMCP